MEPMPTPTLFTRFNFTPAEVSVIERNHADVRDYVTEGDVDIPVAVSDRLLFGHFVTTDAQQALWNAWLRANPDD